MTLEVTPQLLANALARVPAGRWGVAVSGGADSVCLLRLAALRHDLHLHLLHLDHQTRGEASTGDAQFAASLARSLQIPATVARLSDLESALANEERSALSSNRSARFRTLRLALYRREVAAHHLQGVLLAHHADDQAETILLRLMRGGSHSALAGMADQTEVAGVRLLRPLLNVRRSALRDRLTSIGQDWREDASNTSDDQARNRVRKILVDRPKLTTALLEVADNCRQLRAWVERYTSPLEERFAVRAVWDQPEILAKSALGAWLRERGAPAEEITSDNLHDLLQMCRDAASPARLVAPGKLPVRRRAGTIFVEPV